MQHTVRALPQCLASHYSETHEQLVVLVAVIAPLAMAAAALVALLRSRLRARLRRAGHTALVAVTVASTVAHALLNEGTIEPISKIALCVLSLLATIAVVARRKAWRSSHGTRRS